MAEGGGLLNRYTVEKPYRGFESLSLLHLVSVESKSRLEKTKTWGRDGAEVITIYHKLSNVLASRWLFECSASLRSGVNSKSNDFGVPST